MYGEMHFSQGFEYWVTMELAGGMTFDSRPVLVVENEPMIGLALEDMLSAEGPRMLLAYRVDDACQIAANEPVEAPILDVNVHGVRSDERAGTLDRAGIPFIFATGYSDLSHPRILPVSQL